MQDLELTQEKKEQLIRRVTEATESGVLKMQDWIAIYDILLEACHREEIATIEQYMIDCLNEECSTGLNGGNTDERKRS